jgi:ABC-type Mn2+/Zn2+ transport system permease subunit
VDVLDPFIDPLRSGIDRRALAEVALLGVICGGLSFWVVAYRLAYPAESLAHGLLPGLVLASLAGAPLVLGALAGVAVAAGLVALAARDERIEADTATAVVITGLFGLGALLALAPETPARLGELLFGDPLGVTDGDLAAAVALVAVGGVALAALHRPLAATAFDPVGARSLGVAPAHVQLALLLLLAVATGVAVTGLGSLLVLAVLVAPAVAVRRHASSPPAAMAAGAGVAVFAGTVGIYASHHLGSAAGASVALALVAAAAAGSLRAPRRAAAAPGSSAGG